MERIFIFDTTLRDGEQAPGASMTLDQKLAVAKQLEILGVDIIEAGFPVSSPYQFETVRAVAGEIREATIAALARAVRNDIDKAAESIRKAVSGRIHTFIATSPIHMEYKLKKTPDEVLTMAVEAVRYARNLCSEVEFSAEDGTRSDVDFLCRITEKVIDAGARIVNIPDTVGYSTPEEYGALIAAIRNRVPNIDKAILSVHNHNDLGMGVATSLAGVQNGARQIECTVNGIGERAGNAAMEEIVMAMKVRKDLFPFEMKIDTRQIYKTSRLVANTIAYPLPKNKAVVGENTFLHESGIHQDGVLKYKQTYEIMRPEDVGREVNNIVLGRHSGRNAILTRIKELGISLSPEETELVYNRFLKVADKKKEVYDEDLFSIVNDELGRQNSFYTMDYFNIISGNAPLIPTATVELKYNGESYREAAVGDGPVAAVIRAIDRITGLKTRLTEFNLQAVTPNKNALGEAGVSVLIDGKNYSGRGSSTDILEATAKAYLNAVNNYCIHKNRPEIDNETTGK